MNHQILSDLYQVHAQGIYIGQWWRLHLQRFEEQAVEVITAQKNATTGSNIPCHECMNYQDTFS